MAVTKEQALAELARRELERRGSIPSTPTARNEMPRDIKTAFRFGTSGILGGSTGSTIDDIPGIAARTLDVLGGGVPGVVTRQAPSFLRGGIPGAGFAEGSNIQSRSGGAFGTGGVGIPIGVSGDGKDVFRQSGADLPRPETLSGEIIATGASIAAPIFGSRIPAVKNFFGKPPIQKSPIEEAEELTTRVLQPRTKDLANSLKSGNFPKAVQISSRFIKKSKNFGELRENLKAVKQSTIEARNRILAEKNRPFSGEYINSLRKFIRDRSSKGQLKKSELNALNNVLQEEIEFYNKNRSTFDLVGAESRKEFLQDLTERVLTKIEGGQKTQTQPFRQQALNVLRRALKNEIEKVDPRIAPLNEQFSGLNSAENLASIKDAESKKEIPKTLIAKLIDKTFLRLFSGGRATFGTSVSDLIRLEQNLPQMTGRIESLSKKAPFLDPRFIQPEQQRQLAGAAFGGKKLLSAPIQPKQLTASPEFGRGFVRVTPEESLEAIRAQKFKEGFEQPIFGARRRGLGKGEFTRPIIDELIERFKRRTGL